MDALFKLSESAASSVSSMFNKEEKYQEIGMGDFGENEGISGRDVESGGRKGLVDYVEDGFSLSYTQRLYGFVICFVLGWVISFWSIINSGSVFGNPGRFAMCYSLGNVVSIFSTMFLWGPCAQLQSMFDHVRIQATTVYLASILVTIFTATVLQSVFLVLLCMLVQFFAMVWYCASYIPWGRSFLRSLLATCCHGIIDIEESDM